jgi:hypothetical protein
MKLITFNTRNTFIKLDWEILDKCKDNCTALLLGFFQFKANGLILCQQHQYAEHIVIEDVTVQSLVSQFKDTFCYRAIALRLQYLHEMGLVLRIKSEASKLGSVYKVCAKKAEGILADDDIPSYPEWYNALKRSRSAKSQKKTAQNFLPVSCDINQKKRDSSSCDISQEISCDISQKNGDRTYIPKKLLSLEANQSERESQKLSVQNSGSDLGLESPNLDPVPTLLATFETIPPNSNAGTRKTASLETDRDLKSFADENDFHSQKHSPKKRAKTEAIAVDDGIDLNGKQGGLKPRLATLEERESEVRERYLEDNPRSLFESLTEEIEFVRWAEKELTRYEGNRLGLPSIRAIVKALAKNLREGSADGADALRLDDFRAFKQKRANPEPELATSTRMPRRSWLG